MGLPCPNRVLGCDGVFASMGRVIVSEMGNDYFAKCKCGVKMVLSFKDAEYRQ